MTHSIVAQNTAIRKATICKTMRTGTSLPPRFLPAVTIRVVSTASATPWSASCQGREDRSVTYSCFTVSRRLVCFLAYILLRFKIRYIFHVHKKKERNALFIETHSVYGFMVKDRSDNEREKNLLLRRGLLFLISSKRSFTCYTRCGHLGGTRNSSIEIPRGIDPTTPVS